MTPLKKSTLHSKQNQGCILCKRTTKDELDFGGLLSTKTIQAHHFCLLLSESISQSGKDNQGIWGFLNSDIMREVEKSKTKQCHYCQEFGATLVCNRKSCKRRFHLPCGIVNRTQHDMDKFVSYCHAHRKSSNIPAKIKNKIIKYSCLICMESFKKKKFDLEQVIWANCCKKDVLLHIACVKRMALSAGYFTKCPACNNNQEFIDTIKKFGIFVPERDAAWEFERNAFGDLLYRHNRCDVDKCICPKGRVFKQNSGKWRLILCELCGSFGSHKSCAALNDKFICKTCSIIEEPSNINTSETTIQSSTTSLTVASENSNLHAGQLHNNESDSESDTDVVCIDSDTNEFDSDEHSDSSCLCISDSDSPDSNDMVSNRRKRKLPENIATASDAATKKSVYSQTKPQKYAQVAKKSTGGNQIYCNIWSHQVYRNSKISDVRSSSNGSPYKFSNPNNAKPTCENFETNNILHGSNDFNAMKSLANMISNIEQSNSNNRPNCYQFLCSGPLIVQCTPGIDTLAMNNHNEFEFINPPNDVVLQRTIPSQNSTATDPVIVIDDSDEENESGLKITEVRSMADIDGVESHCIRTEESSAAGIFENRNRLTTKDLMHTPSSLTFKHIKSMKPKVVKIDFKPQDSN